MNRTSKKVDYDRKLPTKRPSWQDRETGKKTKITNNHLGVYYWLISKAYWNSEEREQHYYLYRDKVNFSEIARDLGIGRTTVYTVLEKLECFGLICTTKDRIFLPHPEKYTYLDINLIKVLVKFSSVMGAEILLLYSILKRMFELDKKNKGKTQFTIGALSQLLGHHPEDTRELYRLRIYLDFFENNKLIKISKERINKGSFSYNFYTLWDIRGELVIDDYVDESGLINITQEILEKYKDIIEKKETEIE